MTSNCKALPPYLCDCDFALYTSTRITIGLRIFICLFEKPGLPEMAAIAPSGRHLRRPMQIDVVWPPDVHTNRRPGTALPRKPSRRRVPAPARRHSAIVRSPWWRATGLGAWPRQDLNPVGLLLAHPPKSCFSGPNSHQEKLPCNPLQESTVPANGLVDVFHI
jgi:hypothetical protein